MFWISRCTPLSLELWRIYYMEGPFYEYDKYQFSAFYHSLIIFHNKWHIPTDGLKFDITYPSYRGITSPHLILNLMLQGIFESNMPRMADIGSVMCWHSERWIFQNIFTFWLKHPQKEPKGKNKIKGTKSKE